MSAVLASVFLAEYPEFASMTLDYVQSRLDFCEQVHCPSAVWTDPIRQEMAIKLRTAHYLDCWQQQIAETGSMGAAVSQNQQATAKSGDFNDLNQTAYGRQFKSLMKTLPLTGFTF